VLDGKAEVEYKVSGSSNEKIEEPRYVTVSRVGVECFESCFKDWRCRQELKR